MMTTDPIGVYVHIPYCIQKCNYCDFCSLPIGEDSVSDTYIEKLIAEIYEYRSFGKIRVSTLYFGGGTPSLLSTAQLSKIVSALKEVFDFEENFEFSLEMNPGTVNVEKLLAYKEIGINRISIGVQSFVDGELALLGRIHNKDEAIRSFKMARNVGFDNVSIDLMYGIPGQSTDSFKATLSETLSLCPDHISVYGLIVEEGTPFFENRDSLLFPSEDEECEMYYLATEILRCAGYEHYEISNYSIPGKRSKHNLKYWQDEEYIGLGVSAHSYFRGRRYGNTDIFDEYISDDGIKYHSVKPLAEDDIMYEYAMMRLRLSDGISLEDYKSRFGVDFMDSRRNLMEHYSSLSLVDLSNDRIRLTERGFYVSNSILSELL